MKPIMMQDGLSWSSLFLPQNEKQEQYITMLRTQEEPESYHPDTLVCAVTHDEYLPETENSRQTIIDACERTVLKFCIADSDFVKDLFSREDFEKAQALYHRKQWNAGLFRKILAKFLLMLSLVPSKVQPVSCRDLFLIGIHHTQEEIFEEQTDRMYKKLKQSMDTIASGVCAACYLVSCDPMLTVPYAGNPKPDHASVLFVKNKYHLDLTALNTPTAYSSLMEKQNSTQTLHSCFCRALLDEDAFWKEHSTFNVFSFIAAVRNYNDEKHAEKILDHIIRKLMENPHFAMIAQKNLPPVLCDREALLQLMEQKTRLFNLARFEQKPGYAQLNGPFCYPFAEVEDADRKIEEGKAIFLDFLRSYVYPDAKDTAEAFFFQSLRKPYTVYENRNRNKIISYSLADMFDSILCDTGKDPRDREAILAYCPTYFDDDRIRNRLYLEVSAISRAFPKNERNPYLFERFYSAFQIMETALHIKTALQLDETGREQIFQSLCKSLPSYDIHPTEAFRFDYIVSLLDRKVALFQEKERFPVLEQLGDAVWNLCVYEVLFFQPDCNDSAYDRTAQNYICADFQTKVAHRLGLQNLYLSTALHRGKYEEDDGLFPDSHSSNILKTYDMFDSYLADSLEMLIGTVCLENGIETAMRFAKQLLSESEPKIFKEEVRSTAETIRRTDIDRSYFARICPAPYTKNPFRSVRILSIAFRKAMLCLSLGTEDSETRDYISQEFSNAPLLDQAPTEDPVTAVFDWYLRFGIAQTVSAFGDSIRHRYEQICAEQKGGKSHA